MTEEELKKRKNDCKQASKAQVSEVVENPQKKIQLPLQTCTRILEVHSIIMRSTTVKCSFVRILNCFDHEFRLDWFHDPKRPCMHKGEDENDIDRQ